MEMPLSTLELKKAWGILERFDSRTSGQRAQNLMYQLYPSYGSLSLLTPCRGLVVLVSVLLQEINQIKKYKPVDSTTNPRYDMSLPLIQHSASPTLKVCCTEHLQCL